MSFESRIRDNPINWSFRVGCLAGITVRVHLLFVFGAAFVLARSFAEAREGLARPAITESLGTIAILFLIVLLHEFGHCWGSRKTGGEAHDILMWPLGGLASVTPADNPWAHFVAAAGGPLVNVVICVVTAAALTVMHGGLGAVPWNPFRGFLPIDLTVDWASSTQQWLRIIFGLSYALLLFNLIPMYPLDGGRLLHCYLWPRRGRRRATMTATFVGMLGAIGLGLVGLLSGEYMLMAVAVFGYMTCHADRQREAVEAMEGAGEFGGFGAGYEALDTAEDAPASRPGFLARRRAAREEARRLRDAEQRAESRRRVDAILEKVHLYGLASLSAEERRVLEEETERQRAAGSAPGASCRSSAE